MKARSTRMFLSALLAVLMLGQAMLGGLGTLIFSVGAAGTPYIETDKDTYYVGEDIYVTAWGDAETDLVFYPIDYVPGRDASLYWATFEGTAVPEGLIPSDTPVKLTDIPGNNKGNPQAEPYYGKLPAGEYKFVLRKNGEILMQHNITVELPPSTVEPYLVTDKTVYLVGEDIYVTAAGDKDVSVNFYPRDFVPGQDATIYYANFSDYGLEESIPMNTPVKVTDLPGHNRGNGQVNHYYAGLPAGEYKFVLRQSGTPIKQVDISIVEKLPDGSETDAPSELPCEPHITFEKTVFVVGEEITFAAWGTEDMSVNFYPSDFVPGQDATIYYANFEGYGKTEAIPMNTPVKITDMPGNNKGNWQVKDYYGEFLPVGDYKMVMRENGTPIFQVDIQIVASAAELPGDGAVRDLTLTGTAATGETLTLSGTLVNDGDTDEVFRVVLSRPLLSTSAEVESKEVTVKAGSTAEVSFDLTVENGGGLLLGLHLQNKDGVVYHKAMTHAIASGEGYYGGDSHTHSTLSDGKDSLKDNFTTAYNKGQAWIYATDHNFEHADDSHTVAALKDFEIFTALTGNEITTEYGHMLEYGTPHRHPVGATGGMWEIMAAVRPDIAGWQAMMDEIISEGGACYLAHPFFFSNTGSWKWPGVGNDPTKVFAYSGFTGIEVYNCDGYDEDSWKKNRMAFEFWDRYNLKGEQYYFGMANTDGHYKTDVAQAINVLMLDEMTADSILEGLKTGHYYSTNGPELRMSLSNGSASASFGDNLPLPESGKATLKIEVGSQDHAITKVVLYGYTMTGIIEEAYQNRTELVLFDSSVDGEAYTFSYEKEIDVANGQFYRVEVFAEGSLYGDENVMGGFAFGNPIWVGESILATREDNVTDPIEPVLKLNKTVYMKGEDIYVTADADRDHSICVYPIGYTPGQDASIYWGNFAGSSETDTIIPSNKPILLTAIPGDNRGNPQADPYYGTLPAGNYKVCIRDGSGSVVKEVTFKVVENAADGATNVALGKPVAGYSSTTDVPDWGCHHTYINDGNVTMGWASELFKNDDPHAPEWITIDLGAVYDISRVTLTPQEVWQGTNVFPHGYRIDVSIEGETFHTVTSVSGDNEPESQDIRILDFEATAARYVRLYITEMGLSSTVDAGYSVEILEMEVWGVAHEGEIPDDPEEDETTPPETDPVETDPVETDPVETDPVETDPVETDPVETDPVETDPVETDPVETDPTETQPTESDTTEPETNEPETNEPDTNEPSTDTNAPGTSVSQDTAAGVDGDKGCASAVGAGAALSLLLSLAGAAYVARKQKE